MNLEVVILTLFPGIMLYAAISDVFTMTIPNRLSLALIAGFVLMIPFSQMSWEMVGLHILASALMLGISFLLFAWGKLGGGDGKFLAATSLWIGFNEALYMYVIYVALLGGALSVIIYLMGKLPVPNFLSQKPWFLRLHGHEDGIPYGVALAIGGILIFPQTIWMQSLAM